MFSKQAEVCHDQTIGNSFHFFFISFVSLSSFMHSPSRRRARPLNIGYRSVCAWKNWNEYAVMHSTAAKLSGKRTRTIQQSTAVEWSKLMNAVLSLLASERAFFLSLSLLCLGASPHFEHVDHISSRTECTVNCALCLLIRFAISFIHVVLAGWLAGGWRQRERVKCRRCELLLINVYIYM